MIRRPRYATLCALAIFTLTATAGCLERKETLSVKPDGTVEYSIEYKGDPGDFVGGDALPSRRVGWDVRDEFRTKDNGDEEQIRTASMTFRPQEPLPGSFAEPGTPAYETSLYFPTTVEIERRRDGTYYHFRRAYEPRALARYEYYQEQMNQLLGDTKGKKWEEMTDQERRDLLQLLRWVEANKQAEYIMTAAEALQDRWPQDTPLRLRRAVLDYFEQSDVQPLLDLLNEPQSDERDQQIAAYSDELVAGVDDVLRGAMRRLRVPRTEMQRFFEAYDLAVARHDVTKDLQDENFRIQVTLPGRIVAHNAEQAEGSTVTWTFQSKALMDRELVLMATSRLRPGEDRPE